MVALKDWKHRGQEITISVVKRYGDSMGWKFLFSLCICDDIRKRHDPPLFREIFHLSFECLGRHREFPTRTVNRVIHKHDNLRRALEDARELHDEKRKYRQNSFEQFSSRRTTYRHM